MRPDVDDRSVIELLRDALRDVAMLVSDEVALARAEIADGLGELAGGAMAVAAGGLVGFVALIILCHAAVVALANFVPDWLAAVIVGGVLAIVGVILVKLGERDLDPANLAPRRAARNVERDAALLREQADGSR